MVEHDHQCCQSPLHSSTAEERKSVDDVDCTHDDDRGAEVVPVDAISLTPAGATGGGWGVAGEMDDPLKLVANEPNHSIH